MDKKAMREALERDKTIVELRALVESYEERLSRGFEGTPDAHAAQAHVPEPLLLLNDVAIDLRAVARESCGVMEAPAIADCFKPEEPEPFSFVYRVSSGVFRVHPRQGRRTAAFIGPFSGAAPSCLVATAQCTHRAAPPVRFHISTWRGDMDSGAMATRLGTLESRFLTVPPRHQGFLVATDTPQPAPAASSSGAGWGLLLATMADPPEEVSNAWAEFSDIALIFSTDGGGRPEVRLLS